MKLTNINKTYHNKNGTVKALHNISLSFISQGMTFIIGESGCGKTTLLNILSGKDLDYDGIIEKEGRVESIEQDIVLFENLSVYDNLLLVCDDKTKIDELLDKFSFHDKNKKVKKLSVGEKRRVQIIRSLLVQASYLVCDEPTASLDYENSKAVMEMLKEISNTIGVIIATHDIALVDEYSERTIRMGKGCIVVEGELSSKEVKIQNIEDKKSLKKHIDIFIKILFSRWNENVFRWILLFFLISVIFVVTFLFPSLNAGVDARSHWYNADNIILSEPTTKKGETRNSNLTITQKNTYTYYDLYQKEDVELVHDNIDGVLGYRIGWDKKNYNVGETTFVEKINIDGLREIIDLYKEDYERTGKEPFVFYSSLVKELERIEKEYPNDSFPKDEYRWNDYSDLIGFDDAYDRYALAVPNDSEEIFLGGLNIVPYQLFSKANIDLKTGVMPSHDHEMVITEKLAQHLCRLYGYSSIEDIIKEQFAVEIGYALKVENFTICGITNMENRYENQVFVADGVWDDLIGRNYQLQPDEVSYQYIAFLSDPLVDSESLAILINSVLESHESHFVPYQSAKNERESYQNSMSLIVFALFSLLVLFMAYLMMQLFLNKRICKENSILKRYGYHTFMMQMAIVLLLLVLAILVQFFFLEPLCKFINIWMDSNIVKYDSIHCILSYMVALIIVVILEGGIYAVRIKKH